MTVVRNLQLKFLVAGVFLASLTSPLRAWQPTAGEVDAAVGSGEFGGYLTNVSGWLSQQAPADPQQVTPAALATLLGKPGVALALAQRQFIAKVEPGKLGAFAKAGATHKPFLTWLLKNPDALQLYLLGATPLSLAAREDNSYGLATGVLDNWAKIFTADPASRDGIHLRLAIATALRPPGTGSPGSGQQKTPSTPLVRYTYFKTAHANKELFPSFDNLTVWEMQFVVCSGASETDLSWGREMVNTYRPDLLAGEKVVDTTSLVWRRNSPISHVDYKTVLDGGGKCGPRSSWSVFICQAWGIPAIGVGQPAHACVAYKAPNGWQVAYGRGWDASRLEGMGGREFVAAVAAREQTAVFSTVERLRWFAATLSTKEQAAAVRAIAQTQAEAPALTDKELKATEKPDDGDGEPAVPAVAKGAAKPDVRPEPPVVVPPGVIHVEAPSFAETGGITVWGGEPKVAVLDSHNGGKQLLFAQGMASCWVGYKVHLPETGIYQLVAKVATVNSGQAMYVRSFGAMATVKSATASAVYRNQVKDLGPQFAVDNNPGTRWAVNMGVDQAWIDLDLGKPTPISTIMIDERAYEKVSKFKLEYKVGNDWKPILEDTTIGNSYAKDFPLVTAEHVRLTTLDCSGKTGGPTFWEISVGTMQDGHGWISLPWTAGVWETTKPMDIRLVKGDRMLWFFTPYQRGVAFKSFDLKFKGGK